MDYHASTWLFLCRRQRRQHSVIGTVSPEPAWKREKKILTAAVGTDLTFWHGQRNAVSTAATICFFGFYLQNGS
jgi:hypothetical protein